MKKTPKDVDDYINSAPKNTQNKLKELRVIIKKHQLRWNVLDMECHIMTTKDD